MDNEAKPVAKAKKTDYENIEVDCPSCGQECNFNRASELCTLAPVPGKDVTCGKCKRDFRLSGDSANERHEMLHCTRQNYVGQIGRRGALDEVSTLRSSLRTCSN